METNQTLNEPNLTKNASNGYPVFSQKSNENPSQNAPFFLVTARLNAGDKLQSLRIKLDDPINPKLYEEALAEMVERFVKSLIHQREVTPKEIDQKYAVSHLSESDRVWLENLDNFVQHNLGDVGLSVPILAQNFAMSESSLYRQLMRLLGVSPVQYLLEKRLLKAQKLLYQRTFKSVAEVASQVGYSDTRSFTRRYYKRFGQLPSDVLKD